LIPVGRLLERRFDSGGDPARLQQRRRVELQQEQAQEDEGQDAQVWPHPGSRLRGAQLEQVRPADAGGEAVTDPEPEEPETDDEAPKEEPAKTDPQEYPTNMPGLGY